MKRGIALGRYLQNPLTMAATLCGPGKEILSWKLSPLESFITSDEKYSIVEQIMVDATNQVGVELNLAITHEWLFAPLQFISGLGPTKAVSLQRSLIRSGSICTRKDLLTHGLGRKVFINSVGFLRVKRSGNATSSSQSFDLLDDTRIHPESYNLAEELAKEIYRADAQDDVAVNDDDDDVIETAMEHVRENPDLLKSLDIDSYAKSKKREDKKETFNLIKQELINGFQDWRREYVEPSQDEEFLMISGETESTLSEGRIVRATVRRVLPQRAICSLESGLSGMLNKEDYSDDLNDEELTEKLKEGDVLTCKIKSVVKDRYQVYLSCKENVMRSKWVSQNDKPVDPYYNEVRDSSGEKPPTPSGSSSSSKVKEITKKLFKPRMIAHPRFKNVTIDEAIEVLITIKLNNNNILLLLID